MAAIILGVFGLVLLTLPVLLALTPLILAEDTLMRLLGAAFIVPILVAALPILAGLFSIPFHSKIKSGRFVRNLSNRNYAFRRFYGLCWTTVYYCSPIYFIWINTPGLKTLLFRIFGYKGSTDFTLQPDTWIRDLPLLSLAAGSYIANKSTIGTNICLSSGHVLVDSVTLQEKAMVGHMSMVAPGSFMGVKSELGVGSALGIRAHLGDGVKIGGCCAINHGAQIGKDSSVGTMSYIGIRAEIGEKITIHAGANIPGGAVIRTQKEADNHMSSELSKLSDLRQRLAAAHTSRTQELSSVFETTNAEETAF